MRGPQHTNNFHSRWAHQSSKKTPYRNSTAKCETNSPKDKELLLRGITGEGGEYKSNTYPLFNRFHGDAFTHSYNRNTKATSTQTHTNSLQGLEGFPRTYMVRFKRGSAL